VLLAKIHIPRTWWVTVGYRFAIGRRFGLRIPSEFDQRLERTELIRRGLGRNTTLVVWGRIND
jgi:hypothetical protein